MKKKEILDCVDRLDPALIDGYAAAAPRKVRAFPKWLLPVAACFALLVAVLPTALRSNAPDREYEARHTSYQSAAAAATALGDDFPFLKLEDKSHTEITLGVNEAGAFADRAAWTDIVYFAADEKEKPEVIEVSVFLPAFTGSYPAHLSNNQQTVRIGETDVIYSLYEKGSAMSGNYAMIAAVFTYRGDWYEYLFRSPDGVDNGFAYLHRMLGN